MTIYCRSLTPPVNTKAECLSQKIGLLDCYGEPPAGEYFWPKKNDSTLCWSLDFCYDNNTLDHLVYAAKMKGV